MCQQALLNRLEPIFEPVFDDASFGYRRGRSTKDALRKVWKEIQSGSEWIVDADLRDFFGSADCRRQRLLAVHFMLEWENGEFLGRDDSACLEHAAAQGLTLVTYDRRTIPPVLKTWAEEERDHGGVIFIDEKTLSPADIGGQVRALSNLVREAAKWDWANRACFLHR